MTVTVEINGRTHTIDDSEPVGAGNEAIVHPMPDGRVIKLYSKPIKIGTPRGNDTLSKLRIMIKRPPVTDDGNGNKVLAWPQEVALQPASLHGVMLAGFTMPRVGGDGYRSIFEYWNPKTRNSITGLKGNREATDRLLEGIIANMINNVNGIHEQGYIIGDINEKNILVGPNALINIIDCDSFQVKGYKGIFYKCPVGRPEYTSPRLHSELKQICTDTRCSHQPGQKRSYSCLIRTKEDDAFALAVMLYQLLMEGWHPYNDGTDSNVQEKILSVSPLCVTDPSQMPVPARERWHKLNDTWQNYFQDTLTGTRSWTEDEIPGTDRIFKTKGFRPQVIIETEESANNPSVPATNTESTPSKKVLPDPNRRAAREAQQRAREAREAREEREERQRTREALEERQRTREAQAARAARAARAALIARESREAQTSLELRELREARAALIARESREAQTSRELREAREARAALIARESREAREAREARESGELWQRERELVDERDEREAREAREARAALIARESREARAAREAREARKALIARQSRESGDEREARQREREAGGSREAREARESWEAGYAQTGRELQELRELRELRELQQRAREAGGSRESREAREARESRESRESRELEETQQRARELRKAWEARDEREAREAPTNVCPNCLNPFRQGEVYCQTANCITVLQTKTKLCRGRGCRKGIPYTAAFCRHCGLRQ